MTSLRFVPKKIIFLFLGDLLIIVGAYLAAVFAMSGTASLRFSGTEGVLLSTYVLIFYLAEFYDVHLSFRDVRYIFHHISGMVIGSLFVALMFFIIPETKSGRSVFVISSALIGLTTLVWRFVFSYWFMRDQNSKKRLLIVGAGRAGKMLYHVMKNNPHYHVLGFMIDDDPDKWGAEHFPKVIGGTAVLNHLVKKHKIDILVLAISQFKDPQLLRYVLDCKLDGVVVEDMPSFYERVLGKVPVEHITDFWLVFTPLLGVKRSVYNLRIKRIIDIFLSFFGLLLTLPMTAAVALAIKLDSKGPVLYRQPRIGLDGKPFTLVKFRSMIAGTEKDREFAGERNDPRITRVGKFIRLSRMDEIPQMLNVLSGDMSFIGPRALIESEVTEFTNLIPYFSLRHSVRPGITGWAQVKYKHGARVEDGLEKLQYDLFYIKNLSPLLDFHILLRTVKVVLLGKGAR